MKLNWPSWGRPVRPQHFACSKPSPDNKMPQCLTFNFTAYFIVSYLQLIKNVCFCENIYWTHMSVVVCSFQDKQDNNFLFYFEGCFLVAPVLFVSSIKHNSFTSGVGMRVLQPFLRKKALIMMHSWQNLFFIFNIYFYILVLHRTCEDHVV